MKRYDLSINRPSTMCEDPYGEWVRFEDVAAEWVSAAASEVARAEGLEAALREVIAPCASALRGAACDMCDPIREALRKYGATK